jgi:predicted nucleic acid-binding protein
MPRRSILDSSKLIGHWRRRYSHRRRPLTPVLITAWATELIELNRTNAIVTPVAVEFLGGFTNRDELHWGEMFLDHFQCIDKQEIPEEDWDNTRRLARRVPRTGKRRQLGDCLIRAIADRLRYQVLTDDQGFPP